MPDLDAVLAEERGPAETADLVAELAHIAWDDGALVEALETAPVVKNDRAGGPSLGVSFDLEPVDALVWARTRAAELVVEVDDETRSAIRDAVVEALQAGRGTDPLAAELRSVVGLHSRWAKAVQRYRATLESQGLPPASVDRSVDRYRERLIRRRAEIIARTELVRANSEARQETWRRAQAAGAFGQAEPVREWVTAPLGRPSKKGKVVCPWCRPLNGVRVEGLDSTFASGRHRVVAPPLHPACRCTLRIVEGEPTPADKLPPTTVALSLTVAEEPDQLEGSSTEELAELRRDLPMVKAQLRGLADAARDESRRFLELSEGGGKLAKPPARRVRSDALGRKTLANDAGEWDWFFALHPKEQARLRRSVMVEGGIGPDVLADAWSDAYGGSGEVDEVMGEWLWHNRRIEANGALRRGRSPNPDLYGGLGVNDLVDTPYDIEMLYGDEETALRHLAEVRAGDLSLDAERSLPRSTTGQPMPWAMSEADYVAEVDALAPIVYAAEPVSEDEFSVTFSPADQAALDRFAELVPSGIEGSDDPESWGWLYRVILALARTAGVV